MTSTLRLAAAFALCLAVAGCQRVVSNGEKISGALTFEDGSSKDSNDLYFVWDPYAFNFTKGKTYAVELWATQGPVHFEIKPQGIDYCVYDGTDDGYSTTDYVAPKDGAVDFDIYVRSDFVSGAGGNFKYDFRITEK